MQSPMPDSGESASEQATEPKAQRVFIFRDSLNPANPGNIRRYEFQGDVYVKDLVKETPRSLAALLTESASTLYPELKGMIAWRIVENTAHFSVPDRATWAEMKYILLGQDSWLRHLSSDIDVTVTFVQESIVATSIHVMGRIDLSDVKNPLIAFLRYPG